jgi:hypothetical protein
VSLSLHWATISNRLQHSRRKQGWRGGERRRALVERKRRPRGGGSPPRRRRGPAGAAGRARHGRSSRRSSRGRGRMGSPRPPRWRGGARSGARRSRSGALFRLVREGSPGTRKGKGGRQRRLGLRRWRRDGRLVGLDACVRLLFFSSRGRKKRNETLLAGRPICSMVGPLACPFDWASFSSLCTVCSKH